MVNHDKPKYCNKPIRSEIKKHSATGNAKYWKTETCAKIRETVQPVTSCLGARKCGTGTDKARGNVQPGTGQARGNLKPLWRRENVQPVPAKHGEICNRGGDGKMCNRYRPNTGQFAIAAETGKCATGTGQRRGNLQPLRSTGKCVQTGVKREKMCNRCQAPAQARENVQQP